MILFQEETYLSKKKNHFIIEITINFITYKIFSYSMEKSFKLYQILFNKMKLSYYFNYYIFINIFIKKYPLKFQNYFCLIIYFNFHKFKIVLNLK